MMDRKYMKIALELAKNGEGRVSPNPMVGAIIVKNGSVIAGGHHREYGKAHAEVDAFENATEDVEGATMYVTLEPCSHFGKTPPCADKIIEKKISKVVIGSLDPNPLVAGNGVKKLQDAGVIVGVLEDECKDLNEVFMKYILEKKPFVVMKSAMSLDGKIATYSGESKWISGEESRKNVHKLRNKLSSIMVGVQTVIKDNPELTCRTENGRNPIRIVVDSTLRIPIESKLVEGARDIKTIVATTDRRDKDKEILLKEKGVIILVTEQINNQVDLLDLMKKLGALQIDSVLLEGGATLNFSALAQGIVDKVQVYIAPMIIGGDKAKTIVGGTGVEALTDAFKLRDLKTSLIGQDILIEGYVKKGEE
ncbi:Riboflavin biosynthesis protein RibD [Clostridium vincentii]|uniref:Riboflavin biosynthesis protein RibD n=2 Tax=Clostridium vincentii TaxID=52704 RepID=A0A2T0BKE7_9CLOT|nr:Riboflavin biosynthesis protein RibD [Clostridium vincentii]